MSLTRARWRLWLTLLCLVASTVQGSFAQVHFHAAAGQAFVAGARVSSYGPGLSVQRHSLEQPLNHANTTRDSAACPLCQVLLVGGGLPIAPFEVFARASAAHSQVTFEQVPACLIAAVSYDWTSRGPPLI
jgi:hypothetical protein